LVHASELPMPSEDERREPKVSRDGSAGYRSELLGEG